MTPLPLYAWPVLTCALIMTFGFIANLVRPNFEHIVKHVVVLSILWTLFVRLAVG